MIVATVADTWPALRRCWIDQTILIMEKIARSAGPPRDRRDEQWARPDLLGVPEGRDSLRH
jgi:hypothetical protein